MSVKIAVGQAVALLYELTEDREPEGEEEDTHVRHTTRMSVPVTLRKLHCHWLCHLLVQFPRVHTVQEIM